ncbi:hypothetical protein N7474_007390 [Penicillium riverlandense]|uniref:uncharacterized protein n=1 Tax=Penicillium riverlandense TaxID=1903569 RepID=UPI00254887C6|nr:uncharacterized protein N7474_007390 [Penicillium riverlandense]KAJ5815613.1 hypothetical protein N7474_007390 [Penicillium riverlandense]
MSSTLIQNWAPDPAYMVTTFASLGVAFHLSILRIEIDTRIGSLLIAFSFAWFGLVVTLCHVYDLDLISAVYKALLGGFWFSAGLGTSTALYRLFFHRLRPFPGPWGAKLSRFYTVGVVKKSGIRYHLKLEEMHRKYGDFVRTGPRELSVIRPSAVHAIHGPQSQCLKSPWYSQVSDDETKISLLSTRNPESHRLRRRAWDRGLGTRADHFWNLLKALLSYQPDIHSKINVLIEQLHVLANQSIDITQWTMYYSFDVMGIIAFSKDFKQLEDAAEHSAIAAMHANMEMIGLLGAVPWLIHLLICIPGLSGPIEYFGAYCEDQIQQRKAKWQSGNEETPTDLVSWLLKAKEANDRSAPPGDPALGEEGRLVIIAGSDTTGTALAHALYFLACDPTAYRRLQQEVDEAAAKGEEIFNNDTSPSLPYLEAIITETLRLKPNVPSGQSRVTPPEGLVIDGTWIPGNTIVIIPQYVIQRDERCFARATEFLPERWLDEGKDLIVDKQAYFPFQIGPYGCPGKQLALLQMRGVLRRIARDFHIALAPGEDGVAFDTEAKDAFTMAVKPLQMVFKKRVKA